MASSEQQVRIAFDDCDPAGILFFGNIFKLAHRGLENWIIEKKIAWKDWFAHSDHAVPIKTAHSEYFKPLRAGEIYCLKIEIKDLRQSSVLFEFQFLDNQSDVCARCETLHVFVDQKNFRKYEIPNFIREKLS